RHSLPHYDHCPVLSDDPEAVPPRRRQREKTGADALVERDGLTLEAIARLRTLPGACEPLTDRAVEEERERGPDAGARAGVECADDVEVETAPVSLIRDRRVREPIAQHDTTGGERRRDHVAPVRRAA